MILLCWLKVHHLEWKLPQLHHVRELPHPTTRIETKNFPSLNPLTEARERCDAHRYPPEHETGAMPSGGHQMVSNPPYFGHANAAPPPTFPSSSHGSGLKGISNGRCSPPSPPHPNGVYSVSSFTVYICTLSDCDTHLNEM